MNSLKKYRAWKTSLHVANQNRQPQLKNMEFTDLISVIFELKRTYEGLTAENEQLRREVEAMKKKVGQTLTSKYHEPDQPYHQWWSYPKKIQYVLDQESAPLQVNELSDVLFQVDENFKYWKSPLSILCVYLQTCTKKGQLKVVNFPGVKSEFYALPEWTDHLGNLLPDYAKRISFL